MKNEFVNTENWDKLFDKFIEVRHKVVDDLNDYLINFFKSSFDTKSFNGTQWKQSGMNPNTLVDTGTLKNSIKTVSKSPDMIHITSDTPYSAIHNEGGIIKITDKMRSFFWSQYYKTNNDEWKYMAISNRKYIVIPKREFIGMPDNLSQTIADIIKKYI